MKDLQYIYKRKGRVFALWILSILFVSSCMALNAKEETLGGATRETVVFKEPELRTVMRYPERPAYVLGVSPPENGVISIDTFLKHEDVVVDNAVLISSLGTEETGYDSNVCVSLDLLFLAQPNDDLSKNDEIIKRIQFSIDENTFNQISGIGYLANMQVTFLPDGQQIIYPQPPIDLCWKVDLAPGSHTAQFQFRQTSGNIKEYVWKFVIAPE